MKIAHSVAEYAALRSTLEGRAHRLPTCPPWGRCTMGIARLSSWPRRSAMWLWSAFSSTRCSSDLARTMPATHDLSRMIFSLRG